MVENNEGRLIVVYALVNANDEVFYVGQTRQLFGRFQSHQARFGRDIKLRILQSTNDDAAACTAEREWLCEYMFRCAPLVNGYVPEAEGLSPEIRNRVVAIVQERLLGMRSQLVREAVQEITGRKPYNEIPVTAVRDPKRQIFHEVMSELIRNGSKKISDKVKHARAVAGAAERNKKLTPARRKEIAKKALKARWDAYRQKEENKDDG